jgi:hypothetical protein
MMTNNSRVTDGNCDIPCIDYQESADLLDHAMNSKNTKSSELPKFNKVII